MPPSPCTTPRRAAEIPEARQLLEWYAREGRELPWRVKGAAHPDPYAVWVSEIMLQQTTVKTVCGYFQRWMERFPDVKSLADASLEAVLLLWQGLGYYTRAKKCTSAPKKSWTSTAAFFRRKEKSS